MCLTWFKYGNSDKCQCARASSLQDTLANDFLASCPPDEQINNSNKDVQVLVGLKLSTGANFNGFSLFNDDSLILKI